MLGFIIFKMFNIQQFGITIGRRARSLSDQSLMGIHNNLGHQLLDDWHRVYNQVVALFIGHLGEVTLPNAFEMDLSVSRPDYSRHPRARVDCNGLAVVLDQLRGLPAEDLEVENESEEDHRSDKCRCSWRWQI